MYTVSWVSRHLGLTPSTLRAWEQRYGIVHPTRSEGGYRLYGDNDVDSLWAMADLVGRGVQPAQAAAVILSGRQVIGRRPLQTLDVPAGLPDPSVLIEASRRYDIHMLEDGLDAAFATAGFEYVIDVWLHAAMADVGRAWADGDLNVGQEHFLSAAVMRRLAVAFDAAGESHHGRHVMTGLAPGATHEIATLAFATMLRRSGVRVTYLGSNLPVESWVQAVVSTVPDAVVVGAPRKADAAAGADVANALDEAGIAATVYVGGAGAPPERLLPGVSLADAASWLAAQLARRPRPRVGESG